MKKLIITAFAAALGLGAFGSDRTEVMVVYYPHWHQYPKGMEWFAPEYDWSQGEWAFVKDAKEFFPGQINFRSYVGYLDGKDPNDVATEIALAHNVGIDIFLYDYYWYNGDKTQEEAIEQGFLKAKNKDKMKFALMWCYHERTKSWRKKFGETPPTLMALAHTPEEFLGLIDYSITHYFNQPEYWRYRGGLFFSIYNFKYLWEKWGKDAAKIRGALAEARRRVRTAGLGEIHFNAQGVRPNDVVTFAALGLDSTTDYGYNAYQVPNSWERYRKGDKIFAYSDVDGAMQNHWQEMGEKSPIPYIPIVPTGWDASGRCRRDQKFPWPGPKIDYPYSFIFTNNTDTIFEKYLRDAKAFADNDPKHPGVVYINAWNEYTEGCWLLPDTQRNDLKLRAIARVFGRRPANRYVYTTGRPYYLGDKAKNGVLKETETPTIENVKYGPHERQGFDVWLPEGWREKPKMPAVICIHGGGWTTGDRISDAAGWVADCHKQGVALFSISYRYLRDAKFEGIVPAFAGPMDDAVAAVKYIREHASEWNVDISRIGLTGGSAGGCSSFYAALYDNCALGVKAVLGHSPQTSLDPKEVRGWMPNATYPGYATPYGTYDKWIAHYDEAKPWIEKYSPAALLRKSTAKKTPAFLYTCCQPPKPGQLEKDPTHGSAYCTKFEEMCKAKGVECHRGTKAEFLKLLLKN